MMTMMSVSQFFGRTCVTTAKGNRMLYNHSKIQSNIHTISRSSTLTSFNNCLYSHNITNRIPFSYARRNFCTKMNSKATSQPQQQTPNRNYNFGLLGRIGGSGFLGGFLGGLGGAGGALIMIPLLRQFTSMTAHEIAGAGMAAVMGGTAVATLSYIEQNNGMIYYPAAITISLCSILGTSIGVKLSPLISARVLTLMTACMLFIGIFPIYNKARKNYQMKNKLNNNSNNKNSNNVGKDEAIARSLILRDRAIVSKKESIIRRGNDVATEQFFNNPMSWLKENPQYILVGTLSGLLTGMMGLGGGIVMITYLAGYTELTQHQVIGTSLACALPQAVTASLLHAKSGNVAIPIMAALACSNAFGMFLSSRTAKHIDEGYLQFGLCFLLLASSMKMGNNALSMWKVAEKAVKVAK